VKLTDQFLYDMYSYLEKAGGAVDFLLKPRRTLYDVMPGPKNPVFEKYQKGKNKRQFNNLIYFLKKNNYIKVKNLQGRQAMMITKKGVDKALMASFKLDGRNQIKRKDGKLIMIIFDIPQKHAKARGLLRSILQNLGYKMFQHSVWISPYDVSQKTEKSLQHYALDTYVRIFLIEKV